MSVAVILVILLIIPVLVGLIFLQIYLSKKEGKFIGLIMPIVSFLLAIPAPLMIVGTGENNIYLMVFITFLFLNIPTFIFLTVYLIIKKQKQVKPDLDKMTKMDL